MHPYLASNPALAQWLAQYHHQLDTWQARFLPLPPPPKVASLCDESTLRQQLLSTLQTEFGTRVGQRLWAKSPHFRQALKANTRQTLVLACQPHNPN
jgi:hypothetical protein